MRIPTVRGIIKRRLLVNFRADPEVVRRLLPHPFRPKLHRGYALVGICLIRLEKIRPIGLPGFLGVSSENAAHRIAVEWTSDSGLAKAGVYIPRRDSGSWLNRIGGGRIFPGEHHPATFEVVDRDHRIDLSMRSFDGSVSVRVIGKETEEFPSSSCFESLAQTSAFFEAGSLGYSARRDPAQSDGLRLATSEWRVKALAVSEVRSSYFEDGLKFPEGTVHFDHALIMRDIPHEWHATESMNHP